MKHVATLDEVKELGDWYIRDMGEGREKHMIIMLPRPAGLCELLIAPSPETSPACARWQWNGSVDKPTLTPSVNVVGCWHGWIQDGQMVAC